MNIDDQIKEIIDRETIAWNTQNITALISIFHNDMVWVWPKTANDHDPVNWEVPQGKFNEVRWTQIYKQLFTSFALIHNKRQIVKIEYSKEGDGGFAVVDIDTLWENKKTGETMNWLGRTCKTYSLVNPGEWKLIHQVGPLDHSSKA